MTSPSKRKRVLGDFKPITLPPHAIAFNVQLAVELAESLGYVAPLIVALQALQRGGDDQ